MQPKSLQILPQLALLICLLLSTLSTAQVYESKAKNLIQSQLPTDHLRSSSQPFEFILSDYYQDKETGVHHHYFAQTIDGIKIHKAIIGVHLLRDGSMLKVDKIRYQDYNANAIKRTQRIKAKEALTRMANSMGQRNKSFKQVSQQAPKIRRAQESTRYFENKEISKKVIPIELVYFPAQDGQFILAWDSNFKDPASDDWWSMRIDVNTGTLLDRENWTSYCFDEGHRHDHHENTRTCQTTEKPLRSSVRTETAVSSSYNVYELPISSPLRGNRSIVTDPENLDASPFGWHDTDGVAGPEYTITRGNNAFAFENGDNIGFSPDGGPSLNFDFPLDTQYSITNQSEAAAITQMFYTVNRLHDIWYLHGWDEAAGNFQVNNHGRGGIDDDVVEILVQDPTKTCNASMSAPNDGNRARMQVHLCQAHDGALDNVVTGHEYAHGLSSRLVGGPGQSCHTSSESMVEGWSDFFGLITTMVAADQGSDLRYHGHWDGLARRYSTDTIPPFNTFDTYGNIADGAYSVHAKGQLWNSALWDMTWGLIDVYGFNPNLEDHWSTGGNILAMRLVMDGLKLTPCTPGFVDGRDAVLAADLALTGGQNQCILWEAFAGRGLGVYAVQHDPFDDFNGNDPNNQWEGMEDFTVPETYTIEKSAFQETVRGNELMYTITINNPSNVCANTLVNLQITDTLSEYTTYVTGSATHGGMFANGILTWTIASIPAGSTEQITFKVAVDTDFPENNFIFLSDFEGDLSRWDDVGWSPSSVVIISGTQSIYTPNLATETTATLTLNQSFFLPENSMMLFYHSYDTDPGQDGGRMEISINNGASWYDLGEHMLINGYEDNVESDPYNRQGFTGNKSYIQTQVDLAAFGGEDVLLRFVFTSDGSVRGDGWYVDFLRIFAGNLKNQASAYLPANDFTIQTKPALSAILNGCTNYVASNYYDGLFGMISCASSGDTIRFLPYLDNYPIYWRDSILIDKDLVIMGNGKEKTIIDGSRFENSIFRIKDGANVTFENLTIRNGGGAAYTEHGGAFFITSGATVNLKNCHLQNHTLTGNGKGAVAFIDHGSLNAINCEFFENTSATGAGVAHLNGASSELFITQSLIYDNNASNGNLIDNVGGTVTLIHNTVANNSTVDILKNDGTLNLYNSIFKNDAGTVLDLINGPIDIQYNLVDLLGDVPASNGNLISAPGFVSATDLHLSDTSSAISAGLNGLIPNDTFDLDQNGNLSEALPLDLEGNPRIYLCLVDLGAYENQQIDASILVTTTADDGPGSLREAVQCAAPGSTIEFDLGISPIHLTSGEIVIDKNLTILGQGIDYTIIDGAADVGSDSRLFNITNGSEVKMTQITFQNGGGSAFTEQGGAFLVENNAALILYNMMLTGHEASIASVVWNEGTTSIFQSLIISNNATDASLGTAITNSNTGTMEVTQNTIVDNTNSRSFIQSDGSSEVYNNIFKNTGIALLGSSSNSNNLVDNFSNQGDLGTVNIGDPLFTGIAPESLALQSQSPAIDQADASKLPVDLFDLDGDNDTTEILPLDFHGNERAQSCAPDVGAFEFNNASSNIKNVSNSVDGATGSLRSVIACASDGDTLVFLSSADYNNLEQGSIIINKDLVILGIPNTTSFRRQSGHRLFSIEGGKTVEIHNIIFEGTGATTFSGNGSMIAIDNFSVGKLLGCTFRQGNASNGLVAVESGTFEGFNCIFKGNTASINLIKNKGTVRIYQCLVAENNITSASGNLILGESGSTTYIYQSTLAGNDVKNAFLQAEPGTVSHLINNILQSTSGVEVINNGSLTTSNNLIADLSRAGDVPIGSFGNLSGDPRFLISPNNGAEYYISFNSPALDAGNTVAILSDDFDLNQNNNTSEPVPYDLMGDPRISGCNEMDIGAFEYVRNNNYTFNPTTQINWLVRNDNDAGQGSLRAIVGCAEDNDTIFIDPGLNMNNINISTGEILIDKNILLYGNGSENTFIDGSNQIQRIFRVNTTGTVSIHDLTIQNGGRSISTNTGGAIYIEDGTLNLANSVLKNNHTSVDGGAIAVSTDGEFVGFNNIFKTNIAKEGSVVYTLGQASLNQCLIFANNSSSNLNGTCISVEGNSGYVEINQCTNVNNNDSESFLKLYPDGSSASVSNSIFANTSGHALKIVTGNNGTFTHNNVLISKQADVGDFVLNLLRDVVASPLFVDVGNENFSLANQSPAISSGDFLTIPTDALDLDQDGRTFDKLEYDLIGNIRELGCQVDLGAFEFQNESNHIVRIAEDGIEGSRLREVIKCAESGDTIYFSTQLNGIPIELELGQWTISKDLTFIGNGKDETIIDGSANFTNMRLFVINGAQVKFEKMTFQNNGTVNHQNSGGLKAEAGAILELDEVAFHNCLSKGPGGAILTDDAEVHLTNSEIHDCSGASLIEFTNSTGSRSSTFTQNLFYNNTGALATNANGFIVADHSIDIIQNTFADNIMNAYFLENNEANANFLLRNNIFSTNGQSASFGIYDDAVGTFNSDHNLVDEHPGDLPIGQNGNLLGAALFESSSDYHIQECSPAVNTGNLTGAPDMDTDGDMRPIGAMVDIGWDERNGSLCPGTLGSCTQPISILCGDDLVNDNSDGQSVLENYPGLTGINSAGREKVFELVLGSVSNLVVNLTNTGIGDFHAILLSDCSDPGSVLNFGPTGFNHPNTAAGTYYIVVDGDQVSDLGAFDLTLDCNTDVCVDTIDLMSTVNDLQLYESMEVINSTQEVLSSATVNYSAGQEINLDQGFEVKAGAEFHAYIAGCVGAQLRENMQIELDKQSQDDVLIKNKKE